MTDLFTLSEVEVEGVPRYAFRLKGEFDHILWYLDGVQLLEPEVEGDPLTIKYGYNIIEGGELSPQDQARFETIMGDIVLDMIRRGIEDENLVFRGGT
jgi:hypothetical protein